MNQTVQANQKDLSAHASLIRDGRHIADMVGRVSLTFDGTMAKGSFSNTITGRQQGRVFIRADGKTNGPWVDLIFVDNSGAEIASIQNHVSPIWECGASNHTVLPSSHDRIEVAMTQAAWDRLAGIKLSPHGGWREEACI